MPMNDETSAFPIVRGNGDLWKEGMSLRDYFAAKAIAKCCFPFGLESQGAKAAYQIADAMLKARESKS